MRGLRASARTSAGRGGGVVARSEGQPSAVPRFAPAVSGEGSGVCGQLGPWHAQFLRTGERFKSSQFIQINSITRDRTRTSRCQNDALAYRRGARKKVG